MSINQDDLQEICLIVNKRNELQKVRNSARHRVIRLANIISSKQRLNKMRKLELLADKNTNKYYKRLRKFAGTPQSTFPDHDTAHAFGEFMNKFHRSTETSMLNAENELSKMRCMRRAHLPEKHEKTTLHHLKMLKQKAIAEREMAKYDIMVHTEETTKKLRRLLKKNGMLQRSDDNGGVSHLVYNKHYTDDTGSKRAEMAHILADEIKQIAFDATVEKELVK